MGSFWVAETSICGTTNKRRIPENLSICVSSIDLSALCCIHSLYCLLSPKCWAGGLGYDGELKAGTVPAVKEARDSYQMVAVQWMFANLESVEKGRTIRDHGRQRHIFEVGVLGKGLFEQTALTLNLKK